MKYYSRTNNSFYESSLRDRYESSGSWPEDAKSIEDVTYRDLILGMAMGKKLSSDAEGNPILLSEVITAEALYEKAKQLRKQYQAQGFTYTSGGDDYTIVCNESDVQTISIIVNKVKNGKGPYSFKIGTNLYLIIPDSNGAEAFEDAVDDYVQKCFGAEGAVDFAISILDQDGLDSYDVEAEFDAEMAK